MNKLLHFAYLYSNTEKILNFPDEIIANIDVINYSFAHVLPNGTIDMSRLPYLEELKKLREKHHQLKILVSIGGYGSSCHEFSDWALTDESRKKFALEVAKVVIDNDIDGIDFDWEYPGFMTGRDVEIDRPNFTKMLKEVRMIFTKMCPKALITAALPGGNYGYKRYELYDISQILDYIHLMTYDLEDKNMVSYHSATKKSPYAPHGSIEETIDIFIKASVPSNKLVVGLPFYGKQYVLTNFNNKEIALGQVENIQLKKGMSYNTINTEYYQNEQARYEEFWDNESENSYMIDKLNHTLIIFDNPKTIKRKCQYAIENKLAGVMYWELGSDLSQTLVRSIIKNLKKTNE